MRIVSLVFLAVTLLGGALFAQTDSVPAYFTSAQARRGEATFRRSCAECHSATEFKGAFFMNRWSSGTVYQLYDFLRTQMPIDDPGSLSADQYVSVIAYVLDLNGLPSGEKEMPSTTDAMRRLIITRPSK